MGGEAKQVRTLGGRPTLCWGARALLAALDGPVAVALPAELLESGEALLREHLPEAGARLVVVEGGARRRDSVAAGLAATAGAETVLVHDAARPFATAALVARVAARAAEGVAVVPAVTVRDTVKRVDGSRVVATVDRARLVAAQTPQGFPLALLLAAHAADAADATDDALLCERAGTPVEWVPGEAWNVKLTSPDDWAWAEALVASGRVAWA